MASNRKKWWGLFSDNGELVKKIEETEDKAREIHEMVKCKGFYIKSLPKAPSKYPGLKTYKPKKNGKYIGKELPIARSSWEYDFMKYLDSNENVISWMSEQPEIPYQHPIRTLQEGRGIVWMYHPDFFVKFKTPHGERIELIEIKPFKQTIEPLPPGNGRSQKLFESEIETYMVNKEKWKAALEYCKLRGWCFRVLTEKDLF
jgi:hypothetical protein